MKLNQNQLLKPSSVSNSLVNTFGTVQNAVSKVTIKTQCVIENYRTLQKLSGNALCAPVLKANAYGLGLSKIGKLLTKQGANNFFISTIQEAISIRSFNKNCNIYCLSGYLPYEFDIFTHFQITPLLSNYEQLEKWTKDCLKYQITPKFGIQLDIGMNRIGLSAKETNQFFAQGKKIPASPCLIVGHCTTSEIFQSPSSQDQLDLFLKLTEQWFPNIPRSLSNSAGIIFQSNPGLEMTRPGIGLYGFGVVKKSSVGLKPAVSFHAQVIQTRKIYSGETVGYGKTYTSQYDGNIAVIGAGYADGIPSGIGHTNEEPGLSAYYNGYYCPIIGAVSMDYLTIETSKVPEQSIKAGDWVEIFGPNVSIYRLSDHVNCRPSAILTSLGQRSEREYKNYGE